MKKTLWIFAVVLKIVFWLVILTIYLSEERFKKPEKEYFTYVVLSGWFLFVLGFFGSLVTDWVLTVVAGTIALHYVFGFLALTKMAKLGIFTLKYA